MVYVSSWSCTMFGSCICHRYQVIHEQCSTFWEETLFVSRCLAPDPLHQQRWSSRWCARGCAPRLRAIVCPYLLEQQDVWWPYSPLEKHTEACNCIIHGKIQPSSYWTNIRGLRLCYTTCSLYRVRCQGEAMLRPWDNRLSKASTWR